MSTPAPGAGTDFPPELPPLPADYAQRMPPQAEATTLVVVGCDAFGRELQLAPEAATAWLAMRDAAAGDGVRLLALSGFRSVARQREIVQRKLAAGIAWEEILRVSACPGHSEHHTGCAIDFGSQDCAHLAETFEGTQEFRWLSAHASRFGFALSYPRNNASGVTCEPWHWRWSTPALEPKGAGADAGATV